MKFIYWDLASYFMSEAPNIAQIALGISTHLRNQTSSPHYFSQRISDENKHSYGIFKGGPEHKFEDLQLIASIHYMGGTIIVMSEDAEVISDEDLGKLVERYKSN